MNSSLGEIVPSVAFFVVVVVGGQIWGQSESNASCFFAPYASCVTETQKISFA